MSFKFSAWLGLSAVLFALVIPTTSCGQESQQCQVNAERVHVSTTPATAGQLLAKTNVSCAPYSNDKMEIQIQVQRKNADGSWVNVSTTMVRGGYGEATANMQGIGRAEEACVRGATYRNTGRYRIDIDGDGEGWWPWMPWQSTGGTQPCP